MQFFPTEKFRYMMGFHHVSDIAAGVGIDPKHDYFPGVYVFLSRLQPTLYRLGRWGICTEWEFKIDIHTDKVWAHVFYIMQGLHYVVTIHSHQDTNRIVIDGFAGEDNTKDIFKIVNKQSSTSNSIGVLRWKVLADYMAEDAEFVVQAPPQMNPQAAAPPQANLLGGANVFLEYLDSLV